MKVCSHLKPLESVSVAQMISRLVGSIPMKYVRCHVVKQVSFLGFSTSSQDKTFFFSNTVLQL